MMNEASRPRVAVFTRPLDNWTSGSGHHLNEILNAALDLNNGRFLFTFVHYRRSDNSIYRRAEELLVPRNPVRAAAVLRKKGFDLVHYAPLTIFSPIWGVNAKKVATLHGAEPLLLPQYYSKILLAHEYLVVPFYARRMDHIVTVSNASARYFTDHFGVSQERITVCVNGLAPIFRVLPPEEVTAPSRYDIPLPYILHVSRFSERKNPWVLLDAFARLVREYELPHTMVCAGGGWDGERVTDRARALGIGERYIAPGFVPDRDVAELMNGASAFVFPSLAEGFGMPTIEAMACGCPVVTTPGFAIREVVDNGALVVDDPLDAPAVAKALHDVICNEELRSSLVKRGLARVPAFSWKKSAERLLSVYGQLLR